MNIFRKVVNLLKIDLTSEVVNGWVLNEKKNPNKFISNYRYLNRNFIQHNEHYQKFYFQCHK